MKHIEESEQVALFKWAALALKQYPMLKFMFASQAGVKMTSALAGARAKRAGNKRGVPDIFLPYPRFEYCPNQCGAKRMVYSGLFIELKRPKIGKIQKGVLSEEQKEYLAYLESVGYKTMVCYGANEAVNAIVKYLDSENPAQEYAQVLAAKKSFENPLADS